MRADSNDASTWRAKGPELRFGKSQQGPVDERFGFEDFLESPRFSERQRDLGEVEY
jgi:hypothetical protein